LRTVKNILLASLSCESNLYIFAFPDGSFGHILLHTDAAHMLFLTVPLITSYLLVHAANTK